MTAFYRTKRWIMNNPVVKIFTLLILALVLACAQEDSVVRPKPDRDDDECLTVSSVNRGKVVEGEYIVAFARDPGLNGRKTDAPARTLKKHGIAGTAILKTFEGALTHYVVKLDPDELRNLKEDESVSFIQPDRIISICACFTVMAPTTVTWNAGRVGYGDGRNKTAWIIDTGVDSDHPDLTVDKGRSRSFLEGSTFEDEHGHGTHVAGIIGALNNQVGTLGVASGASIVSLKVLDKVGEGKLSNLLNALVHVRSNGRPGDVVNISMQLEEVSQILEREIQEVAAKGIYVTIAAGNGGKDASGFSPARTNGKNIYTVSAIDSLNQFASFSNFGANIIDYAAPGVRILSTWRGGGYATLSGTSMAAPHVAGLLLINNGTIRSTVYAIGDPDKNPDPVAHQ